MKCDIYNKKVLSVLLLPFLIVLFVAVAVVSGDKKPHYDLKDASQLFEKFMKDYHRHYKGTADTIRHYSAFVMSLIDINIANEESKGATFDINKFADYTPRGLAQLRGYGNKP